MFLATGPSGLARAALAQGSVEHVAAGFDVRCVAADPHTAQNVYAGTQGDGVLRSDDAGRTWRRSGLEGRVVKTLVTSALIPGRLYAGTKPACVFVSDDGGGSWRELSGFRRILSRRFWLSPAERPFKAYVIGLALSPDDPDLIVAGIEAGALVRSTDGGPVAADPVNADCWYVSVSPGIQAHTDHAQAAIFRSNGGAWQKLGGGLPEPIDFMPYALISGPAPGQLLAGLASGEMWESHDHGDNWIKLELKMPSIERCLVRLQI